jgi:hypothetical protein
MYTVVYEDGNQISDEGCQYLVRSQWIQLRKLCLVGMMELNNGIT